MQIITISFSFLFLLNLFSKNYFFFFAMGMQFTSKSRTSTVTKMMVDNAYISGLMPFFTSVQILVDSVSTPGPLVKWVMIKSSSDMVNAIRKPERIPGRISGNTTLKKAQVWEAPRSRAAISAWYRRISPSSALAPRAAT